MKVLNLNLKNVKIPLIFDAQKSPNVACLRLVFKNAGALVAKKSGLARLCALMLDEGDESMGSFEFAKALEMRAIGLQIEAGAETFNIEINCIKEHFSFALLMLKKLLLAPNFSETTLQKCKNITLGEIANAQNDNDYLAKCGLMGLLYPNTPLAQPLIGSKQSVESINLKDTLDFIEQNLGLNNLFIVLGGNVSKADIDAVCEAISPLEPKPTNELEKNSTSPNAQQKIITKQSEQAYIYFGAPFEVQNEQIFLANVATFVLGESGFGSRLMEEIRVRRGLAYSAYARNAINLSHSHILGYLQTKNESMDEAVGVVREEFFKFIKKGVSKKEIDQAKNFLLGSLPLRIETLFKRLHIAQHYFYRGQNFEDFFEEIKKIQALKLAELNDFITSHDEISKLSFCILKNG